MAFEIFFDKMMLTEGDSMADWDGAKKTANKILDDFNFKGKFVDVYQLASSAGIKVNPLIPGVNERQFSGFLDTNGEKPIIYVNSNESVGRQNWTIAHELGHYFLDHKPDQWGIAWRDQSYDEKDEYEKAADYFAACLLMPEALLRKSMRQYKLKSEDSALLADMFGVSLGAMKYRLSFLGL